MLREAENKVKIEGILSEIDLKYGSYVRDGRTVETIGGTIKVRVNQVVNGEAQTLEIPVNMFSHKLTKAGKINPSYESIEHVMNEFTSIAACGSEEGADRIRITGGRIEMNEYPNQQGRIVSFPRISTSFVSHATGEFKPEATFTLEFAVSDMQLETDRDGIELDPPKLNVLAVVPKYNGDVDVVKLVATNPNVIDAIQSYWEKDHTYSANGRLFFSSKTETTYQEVDFGEPVEKTHTINISDLVITGGSQSPKEDEFAFPVEDIVEALKARKAKLEAKKNKNTNHKTPAPMSSSAIAQAGADLGF